MTPEQRDIPVPFSDLTSVMHRPVLVLSTTTYNRRSDDVLVAAISSNITHKHELFPVARPVEGENPVGFEIGQLPASLIGP